MHRRHWKERGIPIFEIVSRPSVTNETHESFLSMIEYLFVLANSVAIYRLSDFFRATFSQQIVK